MPIISEIGTRSLKTRVVYGTVFLLLGIGALSMLYPLSLLVSGSLKSDTDFFYVTPYPRFWFNDTILFQKYCEAKYNVKITLCEQSWRRKILSLRLLEPPSSVPQAEQDLNDFLAWRAQLTDNYQWYALGHAGQPGFLPINTRLFRQEMIDKYGGSVEAFSQANGIYAYSWSMVGTPEDFGASLRERPQITGVQIDFQKFKTTRPPADRIIIDLDGAFLQMYVRPKYSNIDNYNKLHGTDYRSFSAVLLPRTAPLGELERTDWQEFVRAEVNPTFIRLAPDRQLDQLYRTFLRHKYENIETVNQRHNADYDSFAQAQCPTELPAVAAAQLDWINFITPIRTVSPDGAQVLEYRFPSEYVRVYGPRQAFEDFVAQRRGVPLEQIAPLLLPAAQADYHDCMQNSSALRWEFTTRNYKQVLSFLVLHGRGIINTVIYCSYAIIASLLVNPLAAYALSRYKPPSQYTILLFCMATMSFPAAVVMIPNFLLLKQFPLWQLVGAIVTFFVAIYLLSKLARRLSDNLRVIIALGIGLFVGFWLLPQVFGVSSTSLLNTFTALVLPGMANGYFIFLLKGFFDGLPRELYEAADLDGASEWTKFWLLTMNLSKPILAVIALGAFTGAYSAFMQAVIVIPDRDMWTLMVWVFQLQSMSHQTVSYAALVIAALPTLLMFVLCQRLIIRGIVVPTEK